MLVCSLFFSRYVSEKLRVYKGRNEGHAVWLLVLLGFIRRKRNSLTQIWLECCWISSENTLFPCVSWKLCTIVLHSRALLAFLGGFCDIVKSSARLSFSTSTSTFLILLVYVILVVWWFACILSILWLRFWLWDGLRPLYGGLSVVIDLCLWRRPWMWKWEGGGVKEEEEKGEKIEKRKQRDFLDHCCLLIFLISMI